MSWIWTRSKMLIVTSNDFTTAGCCLHPEQNNAVELQHDSDFEDYSAPKTVVDRPIQASVDIHDSSEPEELKFYCTSALFLL